MKRHREETSNLGERDTFSPARNLGNTLPSISRREIYCDRPRYPVKYRPYFFFFATCCAIRGTTIWTEFFQTVKWITFTSFPRVFFFSFANKKVEIFFFGDKNFFRMTESICRELEIYLLKSTYHWILNVT